MRPTTVTVHACDFYDIVIVGAGPSSLAMTARLREPYPTAIYTDVEHQRFSFLRKHGASLQTRTHRDLKQLHRSSPSSFKPRIAVLDQCGATWMANWRAQFESFGITHLRSPMFFHGHPDIEAMQAYAHRMCREDELVEICGIVGQEKSKHQQKRKRGKKLPRTDINERERKDYFRPSTQLFFDFCDDMAAQYGLDSLVQCETIIDIVHSQLHVAGQCILDTPGMALYTPNGRIVGAKVVIFAAGIGTQPCLPSFVLNTSPNTRTHITHTSEMTSALRDQPFLPPRLSHASSRPTSAVVIGGGLTSAQIVDRLVQTGVDKVFLVCRSPNIKIKHFDFGLDWVSKYKNVKKAAFWNEEDMSARMRMIREAREGGSVNPTYYNRLKRLGEEGRVEILCGSVVEEATWSDEMGWRLELSRCGGDSDVRVIEGVDHIWCATGSAPDISAIRCLHTIRETHPIEYCDGLPCLTDDLQWNADLPLFVIGGFAALHIGPTAYNLEGGRAAAERVAQRLESVLQVGFQDHGDVAEFYSDPRNSNFFDPLDDIDG